ncbi:hypothetical protein [Burkholderia plantarii]|uniref:hypothetical protein n=1 Tax=Burkholderia plantarii TaxID=41899 RepID=UPI0018DE5AF8|nr:hypothetical protein [Burkholderia plantarii]
MAFSFQDGGGAPSTMPRAADRATGMDSFRAHRRLQANAKNEAAAPIAAPIVAPNRSGFCRRSWIGEMCRAGQPPGGAGTSRAAPCWPAIHRSRRPA